jgi:hypothetical protein
MSPTVLQFILGFALDDLEGLFERMVLGDPSHKPYRNDNDEDEARAVARIQYLKLAPSSNRFWGQSRHVIQNHLFEIFISSQQSHANRDRTSGEGPT